MWLHQTAEFLMPYLPEIMILEGILIFFTLCFALFLYQKKKSKTPQFLRKEVSVLREKAAEKKEASSLKPPHDEALAISTLSSLKDAEAKITLLEKELADCKAQLQVTEDSFKESE